MANLPGTIWQKVATQFGAPPQWVQIGNFAQGIRGLKGDKGDPGQAGVGKPGPPGQDGSITAAALASGLRGRTGGRLTLSSTLPVTIADITGAGTLYYLPIATGGDLSLYIGGSWGRVVIPSSTALSLTLTSGKNYDVFGYLNGATFTLVLSAAWTNDTTRADALSVQDGVSVNSVVYGSCASLAGLWLGTIRASGTNTCDDSSTHRFVSNAYNKLPRALRATPGYSDGNTYSSYTTASASFVEANGGTGSKVDFISDGQNPYFLTLSEFNTNGIAGVGVDSATNAQVASEVDTGAKSSGAISWSDTLSEGYHYFDLLIAAQSGTVTFYSDASRYGGSSDPRLTSITALVYG